MREQECFPEKTGQESSPAMSPYGIWGKLEQMHREMNRLFEETILPFREGDLFTTHVLNPKIREEGEKIIVTLELPEAEAKNIEIDAAENYITIKTEQRTEHGEEKDNLYLRERHYGLLSNTIPLPKKVLPDAAEARYGDEILQIVLPKKEEKKTATIRIDVKEETH